MLDIVSKRKHILASCFMFIFIIAGLFTWGLFIFQCVNKIITMWQIIPLCILTPIMVVQIKGIFKKATTTVNNNGETKQVTTSTVAFGKSRCYKKNNIVTSLVILLIVCVLGGICWWQLDVRQSKYTSVVTADIIEYDVTTTIKPKHSSRENRYEENRVLELKLSYEFEGETIEDTYILRQTAKVFNVSTIEVCLNDDGVIVNHYDNIRFIKYCFWLCVIMAIYCLILLIFGFPSECAILGLILFIGVGVLLIINQSSFANWMYHDLSVLAFVLISCGLVSIVAFLNVMFIPQNNAKTEKDSISNM